METVCFKGIPCRLSGHLPFVGADAPDFNLVTPELADVSLTDFRGTRRVVLNIFPSLDTPVCAASVRRFNKEAAGLDDTSVLCVSMDLPFAAGRFCSAEGIDDVKAASAFRSPDFGKNYGLLLTDGPLAGLLARAVVIIGSDGKVVYADLVDEITEEPDYEAALAALRTVG